MTVDSPCRGNSHSYYAKSAQRTADGSRCRSGSRKRSRGADSTLPTKTVSGEGEGCDAPSVHSLSGKFAWESMSHPVQLQSMERSLPYEVSALRAAAAAAVAEFTGSMEPSIQLTAPDKSHDLVAIATGKGQADGAPTRAATNTDDTDVSSNAVGPSGTRGLNSIQHPQYEGVYTQDGCPPHGAKAICGRRPRMEDAYTAVPFLLEVLVPASSGAQPEIVPPRIAPQVKSASNSPSTSDAEGKKELVKAAEPMDEDALAGNITSTSDDQAAAEGCYLETLHFFGVFDGHGGAEAALHCAQTLHQRIAEALAAATLSPGDTELADVERDGNVSGVGGMGSGHVETESSGTPSVLPTAAADPPVDAIQAFSSDQVADHSFHDVSADVLTCNATSFESALTSAFNRTDEEFGKADNAALVGTTAVVTLVGSRQLYIANCGDSRAVLCRAGVAIPLTDDHKAAREDETARVEAAGGQILFWNGVRVMGVLAVSRAIGDHCLRPYVIAEPEVTIIARRPDDELLLLASDGLWDVLSNKEACTLAKRCLRRARQRGASRQSAARIAATVLTRAAVDRGSRDNVTVLVVDLSSSLHEGEPTRTQSALFGEDSADHGHVAEVETSRVASQSP